MGTKKIFYFLVTILILGSLNLYSQLTKINLKEKVNKSDLIVIGKVQEKEGRWGEKHRTIFTYVTVSIEEYIKGSNILGNITVKVPGGVIEKERIGVDISLPTPSFRKREKILLFLRSIPDEKNYAVLYHSPQGKHTIDCENRISGTNYSEEEFVNKIKTIMALEEKK